MQCQYWAACLKFYFTCTIQIKKDLNTIFVKFSGKDVFKKKSLHPLKEMFNC